MGAWFLSSIPQGQESLFENANANDNLISGFQRAKVAWYTIDPLFYRNTLLILQSVPIQITLVAPCKYDAASLDFRVQASLRVKPGF